MPSISFDLIGHDVSMTSSIMGLVGTAHSAVQGITTAFQTIDASGIGQMLSASLTKGIDVSQFKATVEATPEMAAKASAMAVTLFRQGWGDSTKEIRDALVTVGEQLGGLDKFTVPALSNITKGAMAISKGFGVDVKTSLSAVGQMMRTGLVQDAGQALDLITVGLKNGSNRAGDLLSVVSDFSPTFKSLGIDGPTAFGMIKNAMDAGAPSASVAMKGMQSFFTVVSTDGKTATNALKLIGLDADVMSQKLAAGGPQAKEAVGTIIQSLESMTDPVAQQQAGAMLFGKGWKRAGEDTVAALDPTKAKMGDVAGASTDLGVTLMDNLGTKVESIKRSFNGWILQMSGINTPIGQTAAAVVSLGTDMLPTIANISITVLALKDLRLWSVAAGGLNGIAGLAGSIGALRWALVPVLAMLAALVATIEYIATHWDTLKKQVSSLTGGNAGAISLPINLPGMPGANFVPHLASGGIIMPTPGGRPFIGGDGGEPEAVIPFSKMSGGPAAGGSTVVINVTGAVVGTTDNLARQVVDWMNGAQRRGSLPARMFPGLS